ncbi:NSFL1 cofactor p47-like [Homarus americanus]|uniref:NSFL1 cofactor p47-like n=1 Tax=Homarus americanus TaxID=6706 RepID=A0A8J5NAH3_HOMAM|nr:NSFL1 cofactor p47-like [Homarus americanus]
MAERDSLVSQFTAVSGVDSERAIFFLESAAWNLESALSSFYEEGDDVAPAGEPLETARAAARRMAKLSMPGGRSILANRSLGPLRRRPIWLPSCSNRPKSKYVVSVIPDTSKKEERPRDVALKMWRTGFTVDDGPLRTYEDATNAEFLNSIKRSEVPLELIREARGGEVYINMADHRHEDYVQSRSSLRAFSGSGHTLGSLAPMVVGQETEPLGAVGGASVNTTLIASTSKDPKALENAAQAKLNVNTSAPVTNIQVRLPDGSRLVLKVNHSHTIRDIRQFISAARPAIQSTEFALMTTFPYAELTDVSQTVEEGKLLNSALVVKTK